MAGSTGKGNRVSPSKGRVKNGAEVPKKYKAKISANDDTDVIPESDCEGVMARNKGIA